MELLEVGMKIFGLLHEGDDFISPEGSLCRKKTCSKAVMLDQDDSVYAVGELVSFLPHEEVEPCPRHPVYPINSL